MRLKWKNISHKEINYVSKGEKVDVISERKKYKISKEPLIS